MRNLIITQADPFFLAENFDYLLSNLPENQKPIGCIIFDVSPFGKRESFLDKVRRTLRIFGIKFFIYYAFIYLLNKINPNKDVKKVLRKHNIPVIELEKPINNKKSLEIIQELKPDLMISIAGNQIFKEKLLSIPTIGTLNLHTALLPKYRGLMPTFWVLKNNEDFTGVSVFFVDEGIDSGPIVVQKKIKIESNWSQKDLIKHSKKVGMDAIIESINLIAAGNYKLIDNPKEEMTYFSFPKKEDVKEFKKKGKQFF